MEIWIRTRTCLGPSTYAFSVRFKMCRAAFFHCACLCLCMWLFTRSCAWSCRGLARGFSAWADIHQHAPVSSEAAGSRAAVCAWARWVSKHEGNRGPRQRQKESFGRLFLSYRYFIFLKWGSMITERLESFDPHEGGLCPKELPKPCQSLSINYPTLHPFPSFLFTYTHDCIFPLLIAGHPLSASGLNLHIAYQYRMRQCAQTRRAIFQKRDCTARSSPAI